MYKTIYTLDVYTKGGTDPKLIGEDVSAAALNQIKAGRDIDVQVPDDRETFIVIQPYHSIEYVIVKPMRQQVEDPVDDNLKNCTGEVETGTLTIRNPNITTAIDVRVNLGLSEPATYSGIEFSVIHDDEDTFIRGTIPSIAAGESFVLEGIPVGTFYRVPSGTEETFRGNVPGEVFLDTSV